MKVSLVTGANGFIGNKLVSFLKVRGDYVVELVNTNPASSNRFSKSLGAFGCKFEVDILDSDNIKSIISEFRPDEIYHLAGQSSPHLSWSIPAHTMKVNYDGSINVFQAVLEAGLNSVIVAASSSAVYAQNEAGLPITENDLCSPSSPYGISKLALDHLVQMYSRAFGLRAITIRPFFLIGPKKVGDVCSDWARSIVSIEKGVSETLSVGQISGVVRDFLSIDDAIRGIAVVASHGKYGEAYNISSGKGLELSEVLKIFISHSCKKIDVIRDERKNRPIEEFVKIGNNNKLRDLGWCPAFTIEHTLEGILEYWRAH